MITILAATAVGSLLITFLYAILVIAVIGGLIWAINTYIHPIPGPILAVLAIILVIVIALWLLGDLPRL